MKVDFENTSEDVRIELIPLIDVIFCILIFFILAALQLTRQQAISINLPQSTTSALQNRQTLIVSIDRDGNYYVDRTPVSEDQLYLLLEGYHRTNPQGLMLLNADRSAIYDDVVRSLDLMRAVGGDRVALATQPGQAGQGATDPNAFPGLPPNLPGLDGTPPGGTAPGGTVPDGLAPDGTIPNGIAPDGSTPNGSTSDGLPGISGLDAPATPNALPGTTPNNTPGLDAPSSDPALPLAPGDETTPPSTNGNAPNSGN